MFTVLGAVGELQFVPWRAVCVVAAKCHLVEDFWGGFGFSEFFVFFGVLTVRQSFRPCYYGAAVGRVFSKLHQAFSNLGT